MSKVYEIITEAITKKLEAGVCPWKMPWAKMVTTAPRNIKGNHYSGCNFFLMSMLGFADPTFLTYKQAQALGGNVKKGEQGFPVIFWSMFEKKNEKTGQMESIPMLKYFTVFNISQTEGVKYNAPEISESTFQGIQAADRIVENFQNAPTINHACNKAAYRTPTDTVMMPPKGLFTDEEEYYSTLFHELGHSTGHKSRLNRKELGASEFGSEPYSLEELTAELTSAFLCAEAGINSTLDNSANYIGNWLTKLRTDPKAFVTAAGRAQKAANFILGKVKDEAKEATSAA